MIDGTAAAQWLLNYGSVAPSMCLYYVWQAYKAQGASTGMGAKTAYAAWQQSDGKHPGDRNPPAGAAVWWGRRTWDGNLDGDVVISLGGGRVAVTEPPNQGYVTGSCTLDERENEISREYLGWTSSIFDCPISVAAGKDFTSEGDTMSVEDIYNARDDDGRNMLDLGRQARADLATISQQLTDLIGKVPAGVWGFPIQAQDDKGMPIASNGKPVTYAAQGYLASMVAQAQTIRLAGTASVDVQALADQLRGTLGPELVKALAEALAPKA